MKVTFKIRRFDPSRDREPYFRIYQMDANESARLLDSLVHVKTFMDGTLAFRRSCAHGVCGSDGMVINGVERLACKTLIRDVTGGSESIITVEPLRSLPVERDLMVDLSRFFEYYKVVKPFLIAKAGPPAKERIQSPSDREKFDDPTKCILCASCFSACPVENEKNPRFIGPAAIVQAARFIFDSRDSGLEERLPALDTPDGVWACENRYACTKVCPRGIKVTKNINLAKNRISGFKESGT